MFFWFPQFFWLPQSFLPLFCGFPWFCLVFSVCVWVSASVLVFCWMTPLSWLTLWHGYSRIPLGTISLTFFFLATCVWFYPGSLVGPACFLATLWHGVGPKLDQSCVGHYHKFCAPIAPAGRTCCKFKVCGWIPTYMWTFAPPRDLVGLSNKNGSRGEHMDVPEKGKSNRFCGCTGGKYRWEQEGSGRDGRDGGGTGIHDCNCAYLGVI